MEIVEFHANLRIQIYKTVVISEHRNMHMPTHHSISYLFIQLNCCDYLGCFYTWPVNNVADDTYLKVFEYSYCFYFSVEETLGCRVNSLLVEFQTIHGSPMNTQPWEKLQFPYIARYCFFSGSQPFQGGQNGGLQLPSY